MGADPVTAQPAGRRQLQMARQGAVGGQQQEAFRIEVETADRYHARHVLGHRLEDGRASLGIAMGGHAAARLVIAPHAGCFRFAHRLAVDLDPVGRTHGHRRRRQRLAVQDDAALGDPALGVAARAEAGPCHGLGDPHLAAGILAVVPARGSRTRRSRPRLGAMGRLPCLRAVILGRLRHGGVLLDTLEDRKWWIGKICAPYGTLRRSQLWRAEQLGDFRCQKAVRPCPHHQYHLRRARAITRTRPGPSWIWRWKKLRQPHGSAKCPLAP